MPIDRNFTFIHDPLVPGGFRPGVIFDSTTIRYMCSSFALTEGTILMQAGRYYKVVLRKPDYWQKATRKNECRLILEDIEYDSVKENR